MFKFYKILSMIPVLNLRGNLQKGVDVTVNGKSVQLTRLDALKPQFHSYVYVFEYGGRKFVVKVFGIHDVNNVVGSVFLKEKFEGPQDVSSFFRKATIDLTNECDRYLELLEFQNDPRSKFILFPEQFECLDSDRPLHLIYLYLDGGDVFTFFDNNLDEMRYHNTFFSISRRIFEQVANALLFFHDHNMAHLDVKPENVLIEEGQVDDASSFKVRLIDGECLLPLQKGELVKRQYELGSMPYMAPEFLNGKLFCSFGSDSYALGILGCEMYFYPKFPYAADKIHSSSRRVKCMVDQEKILRSKDNERLNYLDCLEMLTRYRYSQRATVDEAMQYLNGSGGKVVNV